MSLRHDLASLLVGYDVERFRREHDEALSTLSNVRHVLRGSIIGELDLSEALEVIVIGANVADGFLNSLPLGAVKRARERLAAK